MNKIDFLEESKCEGCGAYPGDTHKDNCPWLKKSLQRTHEKQKIRDMVERYIDIDGIVNKIYELLLPKEHHE